MSLINDALKRTQENTQSQVPPRADELELKPIEPASAPPKRKSGGGSTWLWIVILVVAVANASLWFVFKRRSPETQVAARVAESEPAASAPAPEPASPPPAAKREPAPAVAPVVQTVSPAPAAVPVVTEPQAAPVAQSEIAIPAGVPMEVAFPVAPAERPELKLKSILSHPTRPSAMIDNQILFVGDRVAGYSITKIENNKVTLSSGSDTMVLTLP